MADILWIRMNMSIVKVSPLLAIVVGCYVGIRLALIVDFQVPMRSNINVSSPTVITVRAVSPLVQ